MISYPNRFRIAVFLLVLVLSYSVKSNNYQVSPRLHQFDRKYRYLSVPMSTRHNIHKLTASSVSGGHVGGLSPLQNKDVITPKARSPAAVSLALWGTLGVVMLLVNAVKRLLPVALQPFAQNDLEPLHIAAYVLWTVYMAYVEGYKAFHLKFSPLVVRRALTIGDNPTVANCVLAGPYSMGLFGATRKRLVVSWLMMLGVFLLVKVVKMLPYPWRSIVDSGVVAGLSIGTLSVGWHLTRALIFGIIPDVDPCLPQQNDEGQSELTGKKLS